VSTGQQAQHGKCAGAGDRHAEDAREAAPGRARAGTSHAELGSGRAPDCVVPGAIAQPRRGRAPANREQAALASHEAAPNAGT
jgi:hypothetical protein